MRGNLRSRFGQRLTITATFERLGYAPGFHGRYPTSVLLCEVEVSHTSHHLCDHAWLPYSSMWRMAALEEGDVVQVDVRVKSYWKRNHGNGQVYQTNYGFKDAVNLRRLRNGPRKRSRKCG